MSLKMLPISKYTEEDDKRVYKEAATLGVGILDYIVASGIKQVDLESTLELEEYLDLNNRLRPLSTSYTQSSTGGNTSTAPEPESPMTDDEGGRQDNDEATPQTDEGSEDSSSDKIEEDIDITGDQNEG